MRKVIAAINMTLDGFCDHTSGIADDEFHAHYNEILRSAGALLYGRITYELMESYTQNCFFMLIAKCNLAKHNSEKKSWLGMKS